VPELAQDPETMVAGEELERARLLGVGRATRFSTTPNCSIERRIFVSTGRETRLTFQAASRRRASGI
jgi:hypothetical protein